MADKPKENLEQKVEGAPGKQISIQDVEKKGLDLVNKVDGFVGDFARYGAASYGAGVTLPMILVNPLSGIVSTALVGSISYIGSNLLYNFATGGLKLTYSLFRHPLDSVKVVADKVASIVVNPIGTVKEVLSLPKKLYEYLIEGGNHNKYGKILGALCGGGLAMNTLSSGTMNSLLGNYRVDAALSGIKDMGSAAAGGGSGLIDAIKEASINLKDHLEIHNPLEPALEAAGRAFDSAVVYR